MTKKSMEAGKKSRKMAKKLAKKKVFKKVLLPKWIEDNQPKPTPNQTMSDYTKYKQEFINQCSFMKNDMWIFRDSMDVFVVSTFKSECFTLPVYQFTLDGNLITMKHDFSSWRISVKAKTEILDLDILDLFDPGARIFTRDYEGMKEWFYKPYSLDKKEFSFNIDGIYSIFCFFKLMKVNKNNAIREKIHSNLVDSLK